MEVMPPPYVDAMKDQYTAKPAKIVVARLLTRILLGALEEACIDPNGEKAERGPGAIKSSGFGGLGLEGIVGMSEPVGVGNTPPGEGNSGAMSGDNSLKGDSEDGGGSDSAAGEDESVGSFGIGCEYDECRGEGMKVKMVMSVI
ncbi:uncharacterized protein LOC124828543 [Vigna umbellata]|uniref:uncharacterized protein LOC124828543 n=1 Tax=Vigna umbellata TaxID=87088 RepID=UPI001F5F163F|nr:uncharacterized protein LOC124828543 [Vigna umbellata]